MEWLKQITDWLAGVISGVWDDAVEFLGDFLLDALQLVFDMCIAINDAIPVPDFMQGFSLCAYLNQAGPVVGWAMGAMHVPAGMSLIASACVFRLVRKVLTLFQW